MSIFILFLFKTSTILFPIYAIATQELVAPCEKNIDPFNSSAHFLSSAKNEWVVLQKQNSVRA